MSQQSDQQLLRQYVRTRSQPAFSVLTARYANLVYSICVRELHSVPLAEDAAQSVFLLLAQRAGGLQNTNALAGWLFTTARLVAQNLRREEQRRQRREEQAMQDWTSGAGSLAISNTISKDPAAAYDYDAAWGELEPRLHDALARLKPLERTLVLLRFGEERTLAQSGVVLGISENTARMRVNRALEKLRRHLSSAGVALSLAALTTLLAQKAAPAAPAAYVQNLIRIHPVANGAAAGAGGVSATSGLSACAKGALTAMAASSTKIFAGAGLALVLALTGWQGARIYTVRHVACSKSEMFRLEMLLADCAGRQDGRDLKPEELAQVRNLLPQLDAEHRSMLIGMIGASTLHHANGPIVRVTLLEYTHDASGDVRNSAASAVAVSSRGNTGVLQRLQQMRNDPSDLVRRNWPGYIRLYTGQDVPNW